MIYLFGSWVNLSIVLKYGGNYKFYKLIADISGLLIKFIIEIILDNIVIGIIF